MNRIFSFLVLLTCFFSSATGQSFLTEEEALNIPDSSFLEVLIKNSNQSINTNDFIKAKARLVEYYQISGDVEKAYSVYEEVIELTKESGNHAMRKRLVLEFTFLYVQNSRFSSGIEEQASLLRNPLIQLSDYEKLLLNSRLGFFSENIGKVTVATDYYFKALKLAEELDDEENVAKMCNNIGNAYIGVGQPREAQLYISKGINLMEKTKKLSIPILYNNLAKSAEMLGDTIKALENYKKCISNALLNDNNDAIITSGINLSLLWIEKNQIDSASYYAGVVYDKAKLFNESSPQMVRSIELNATICKSQKDLECMESNLLKAYSLSKNIGLIIELERLTSKLASYYGELNNADKAYRFLKENMNYFDSINVYEAQDLLLMKIEEKKLDSLRFASYKLETDKKLLELKVEKRNIGLWLVLIALISLFFITYLYVRNVKRKRKILKLELSQRELTIISQNKEILSANLEIEAQEKALGEIKNKLSNQLSEEYDAEFNELNLILKQTNRSLSALERRKYIDSLIKLSDNNFHNSLRENYSDLTSGELKLATLIRLNLGTEELLDIFNISRESLNKKRYRLRKKFGINKEEDLDQFIRSL